MLSIPSEYSNGTGINIADDVLEIESVPIESVIYTKKITPSVEHETRGLVSYQSVVDIRSYQNNSRVILIVICSHEYI